MAALLERRLKTLAANGAERLLGQLRRGIEKESLRIRGDGVLAKTVHPPSLGSPLTHPHITTDYSEALLEFVTPTVSTIDEALQFLTWIHEFVYQNIGNEKLWVNSMPCILRGEQSIPIARYGNSNIGYMKYVYRRGLGYRYGRLMQTIAGIHYNFSVPADLWTACELIAGDKPDKDAVSERYFAAIRNFHRYCWLLFYLFGASPAVCRTFLEGREHPLEPFGAVSFYAPFGTSIRMSSLGYRNDAQAGINISYNCVAEYIESLRRATSTPHPDYERIGVKEDNEYRQLNSNVLQIENEFYAVIRPKRVIRPGERPTHALSDRGVEYIEVRCVDLDPFAPVGITAEQVRFLDVFLLYCLLEDSPFIDAAEAQTIASNKDVTVIHGRDPLTELVRGATSIGLPRWGLELCDSMQPIADILDSVQDTSAYGEAVAHQRDKLRDPERTPSAAIVADMRRHRESFFEFAMRKANEHENYFKNVALPAETESHFRALAAQSWDEQRRIEQEDDLDFDAFLAHYFAQDMG